MSAQKSPRRGVLSAILGLFSFSAIAGLLVAVMVAPAIAVTGVTASSTIGIFDSLPDYLKIGQLPERNRIWATYRGEGNVNGKKLIATIFDQNRQEVTYEEISPFALNAAIDGEDVRFMEHGGVDLPSVVRAVIDNVASNEVESGASTLTMQLVKNIGMAEALALPTAEEQKAAYKFAIEGTFDRKLREMKLAIGLEKNYTKKEILTAYLNIANFGDATYGIQAAAQRYYSVDAKNLTLPQAASLVAIVQKPSFRNLADPENYPANVDRRDTILNAMLKAGSITQQEHDDARAVPVDATTVLLQPTNSGCRAADVYARWFCDYVVKSVKDFGFLGKNEAERKANWKRGGYSLYTTLDMDVQKPTQDATWAYAPNTETAFDLGSASTTVQAGTGRVLVMAQNMIFDDSREDRGPGTSAVNYNTSFDYGGSGGFQPGSTYKLFTLLEWLIKGKGVNERVNGNPDPKSPFARYANRCEGLAGGTFSYKNNGGERGNYSIRTGTVESINGVFFSMAKQLDLCDIRDVALSLGVETGKGEQLRSNPNSIIGTNEVTPLSMASAYAAVAALGKWCKPIIVDSVVLPDGQTVAGQSPECRQAIPAEIAATAIDVLKGVMVTNNQAVANPRDGIPLFGKTGTTDGAEQTWVATGTSSAGSITWVGNSIGDQDILKTRYADVSGIRLRHYIMRDLLTTLNGYYGGVDWPGPSPALIRGGGQTVPDVAGSSLESAKLTIESLGFGFIDGGQVDSDLPIGTVVGTDPPAGTNSAKGADVTVYTSRGNLVSFPDVVGDGESFDFATAKSQLQGAGYPSVAQACVVLAPVTNNPLPPDPDLVDPTDPRVNKVQSTNPAPGTKVTPGAPVTVSVGKISC